MMEANQGLPSPATSANSGAWGESNEISPSDPDSSEFSEEADTLLKVMILHAYLESG